MSWFTKIRTDISNIIPAIEHYEQQLDEVPELSVDLKVMLKNTVEICLVLLNNPLTQLQEIEAILEYPNIEQRRKKTQILQKNIQKVTTKH